MAGQRKIDKELKQLRQKSAILAQYRSSEALFEYLYGDYGQLKPKQLARRKDLIRLFAADFGFDFSKVLHSKLGQCTTLSSSNYIADGLFSWRSSWRLTVAVKYGGRQYDVTLALTPSFARQQGFYWDLPVRLHHHERMLVSVLKVVDHQNPVVEVGHYYHRENDDVKMRANDYYQRYLAPQTWQKCGVFDRHWIWHLQFWQLWLTKPTDAVVNAELAKFKWCRPLAVRRAYLKMLDQIQHGDLLRFALNSQDLVKFLVRDGHAGLINEPRKIYQQVVQQLMISPELKQNVKQYQQDLTYLLCDVFGYDEFKWERAKQVISK